MTLRSFVVASVLVPAAFFAASARADVTIKIATLAPEGSGWMKVFHAWSQAIEQRAPGVRIKYFAGGIAGDERDVVRKMRLGQLEGGAVTGIGLGLIQPEVRVLEIPFFVRNFEELRHVRGQLAADFNKKFADKGFVLLAWGDVGPVHLFSNEELTSQEALRRMKMWAWTDDPMTRKLFEQVGLNGVPLGVPDVLPALQTGLINACYGSPLSTFVLQWFTKVKYMSSMSISMAVGAAVLTRAAWNKLSPEQQRVVTEESLRLGEQLFQLVARDNTTALEKMKTLGMKVVATPDGLAQSFRREGEGIAPKLDGQIYSTQFRQRVEALLAEYRKTGK